MVFVFAGAGRSSLRPKYDLCGPLGRSSHFFSRHPVSLKFADQLCIENLGHPGLQRPRCSREFLGFSSTASESLRVGGES